jgi:hypothetical protein
MSSPAAFKESATPAISLKAGGGTAEMRNRADQTRMGKVGSGTGESATWTWPPSWLDGAIEPLAVRDDNADDDQDHHAQDVPHILVAVDDSPEAMNASAYAAEIARSWGATLTVIHGRAGSEDWPAGRGAEC